MRICTIDGVAYYAKYFIQAKLTESRIRLPVDVDEEGIYCYTDQELERVQVWLKNRDIKYSVEELPPPPKWNRTVGVKYMSNEEVLAHVQDNVEPESLTIPRLLAPCYTSAGGTCNTS